VREDVTVRERERHQQQAYAEDEPGFIGVPKRTNGGDHPVAIFPVRQS